MYHIINHTILPLDNDKRSIYALEFKAKIKQFQSKIQAYIRTHDHHQNLYKHFGANNDHVMHVM